MKVPPQQVTSAATSRNQLPRMFHLLGGSLPTMSPQGWIGHMWLKKNSTPLECLDMGGGKYDKFTKGLSFHGIRNYILDPYNRSAEHNRLVRNLLRIEKADFAVCSNVLNVVQHVDDRRAMLNDMIRLCKKGALFFFTVYTGDRSGDGKITRDGFQANRKTDDYLDELSKVFRYVCMDGRRLIVCSNEVFQWRQK